jgi:hypothetical protein
MFQRQTYGQDSLSLLLLPVFFCWQRVEWRLEQGPDGAVVGCASAEKLGGGGGFVDDAVGTVDDIVNLHYQQKVDRKGTVVEEWTLQEAMELAEKR